MEETFCTLAVVYLVLYSLVHMPSHYCRISVLQVFQQHKRNDDIVDETQAVTVPRPQTIMAKALFDLYQEKSKSNWLISLQTLKDDIADLLIYLPLEVVSLLCANYASILPSNIALFYTYNITKKLEAILFNWKLLIIMH